jgi:hypothetical protein
LTCNTEVAHSVGHEGVPGVGDSSPPTKQKDQVERSTHEGSQPQVEGTLIFPKLLSGVQVDDDMVGGVTTIKYSDHDVINVTKFPDLALQVYLESRGTGSSDMPLIEPTQWNLGVAPLLSPR